MEACGPKTRDMLRCKVMNRGKNEATCRIVTYCEQNKKRHERERNQQKREEQNQRICEDKFIPITKI